MQGKCQTKVAFALFDLTKFIVGESVCTLSGGQYVRMYLLYDTQHTYAVHVYIPVVLSTKT